MIEASENKKKIEYYEHSLRETKKNYEEIILKMKREAQQKDKKIKDLEADITILKDSLENQMNDQLNDMQGKLEKKTQEYEEEVVDHKNTKEKSQEQLRSKQDEIDRLEREKKALEEERKRKME